MPELDPEREERSTRATLCHCGRTEAQHRDRDGRWMFRHPFWPESDKVSGLHDLELAQADPEDRPSRSTRLGSSQQLDWENRQKSPQVSRRQRRIQKRLHAKLRRRQARLDPENAPTKGFGDSSW